MPRFLCANQFAINRTDHSLTLHVADCANC